MEEAKDEIECFSRLFPLLLRHLNELFYLSDELLETLDASLIKQAIEHNLSGSRYSSPFLVFFTNYHNIFFLFIVLFRHQSKTSSHRMIPRW